MIHNNTINARLSTEYTLIYTLVVLLEIFRHFFGFYVLLLKQNREGVNPTQPLP